MKTQGTFMRNKWRTYGVPREADGGGVGKILVHISPAKDFVLACKLVSSAVLCTETPRFLSLLAHPFNLPFLI